MDAYIRALTNFNLKQNGRKCPREINTNPILANAAMSVDGNLGEWYFDMSLSTYSFEECNWVLVEGRRGLRPNRTERKQKGTGGRRGYQGYDGHAGTLL